MNEWWLNWRRCERPCLHPFLAFPFLAFPYLAYPFHPSLVAAFPCPSLAAASWAVASLAIDTLAEVVDTLVAVEVDTLAIALEA